MRLVRFTHEGQVHDGVLEDVPEEGRLLAPVVPGKIVAVGQNYMDHIREQGAKPPGIPILFPKFASCVIGPGEPIRWPDTLTDRVDYEGELAVVIGRRASRVPHERALDVVLGYTNANDVSARDLQLGDGQWLRGKALDTFLPLGPAIVTPDEAGDPQDLAVRTRLNGETVQDSSTSEMVFSVAELIAFITEGITLEPGDVVLTGTPHGVGVFRDPPLFLKPGDEIEVEVGNLGVLANPVGAHVDAELHYATTEE
jgi:2-keto-4-pentenoate hydratase/2-oxohepta-3-ene-1,7-dioic acid hydratase in catechol pathway